MFIHCIMEHLIELKKSNYNKHNAINDLQDIKNIKYFVVTYSKCGTSSISKMLAKSENYETYRNVVHCHSELCWFHTFPRLSRKFNIMDLIKQQNHKPIVFQLMRNPADRIISEYKHYVRTGYSNSFDHFFESMYKLTPSLQYEEKFGYNISELSYDKTKKYCLVDKGDYFIYFTALEHFSHLKNNLKQLFNINVNEIRINESPVNQKTPIMTKDQALLIFNMWDKLLNFYYTQEEIINMKKKYSI